MARRLCGISRWYGWLVDEEYLEASPAARVKRLRASTESTRTWLGRLELAQWLDAAERIGGDIYVLACLLAINALRVGEARGTNVTDLATDRHHRTLRIVGKGDKPAVVPLTARTVHALDQMLEDRDSGPLLRNRHGDRLNRESAGRAVRYISRRAAATERHPRRTGHYFGGLRSGDPGHLDRRRARVTAVEAVTALGVGMPSPSRAREYVDGLRHVGSGDGQATGGRPG